MKFFNTAGPINSQDHYCIDLSKRINVEDIMRLIDQKKYFVLHAPRQTGKTSCLLALMEYLNLQKKYKCLYINIEAAQSAREDVGRAIKSILSELSSMARDLINDDSISKNFRKILEEHGEDKAFNEMLTLWSKESELPIVLFIDEIDSLIGDSLISVLRQLRSGYAKRPRLFPQSIILCGIRDVRDYRIHSSKEKAIITGGSAFNVKAESIRLVDFQKEEIKLLYEQHTEETGQIFENGVFDLVWELTEGQPWLVNSLAYEVCFRMKEGRNRDQSITPDMIEQAKETMILRRDTHIDQLVDKLHEDRVKNVLQPILLSIKDPENIPMDEIYYVRDLGLIKSEGKLRISNRIYQEIIPRELVYSTQVTISENPAWYIMANGQLDMDKLLTAFQEFFREHSESWVERFQYKEAGPQLLIQAFLQRIINSGGRIEREYGLGRMRTDLLIIWNHPHGLQKVVIELKILHHSLEKTLQEGISQTYEYMDKCNPNSGHLIIFDKSLHKSWEQKIFKKIEQFKEKNITIWGM